MRAALAPHLVGCVSSPHAGDSPGVSTGAGGPARLQAPSTAAAAAQRMFLARISA